MLGLAFVGGLGGSDGGGDGADCRLADRQTCWLWRSGCWLARVQLTNARSTYRRPIIEGRAHQ